MAFFLEHLRLTSVYPRFEENRHGKKDGISQLNWLSMIDDPRQFKVSLRP